MTFKVFISASMADQVIVCELRETLGRNRIESVTANDVPLGVNIEQYLKQQIANSDCFLAIIGNGGATISDVNYETNIALSLNRPVITIVEKDAVILHNISNRPYILLDRNDPRQSYERAATYLNKLKVEKEQRGAIGGLVLLGLGLLLLGAIASSDK